VTAVLFSGALLLALIGLALLPSLLELRRPTDVEPLRVPKDHDNHVFRFAASYRTRLESVFGAPLQRSLADGAAAQRAREHGMTLVDASASSDPDWSQPLACAGVLSIPAGTDVPQEIYAASELRIGRASIVRAALSDGVATLHRDACVTRWLHARRVRLDTGSRVQARVSADESIELAPGVELLRSHAPVVRVAGTAPASAQAPDSASESMPRYAGELGSGDARKASSQWDAAGGRWIVFQDMRLAPRTRVCGHLIVRGDAHLGAGSRVEGSLKVHGRLTMDEGVRVDGACVAACDARIGAASRIAGPLVCEGRLEMHGATTVGDPARLTSVTGEEVLMHGGACVHGTVWGKSWVRTL
jgi:predicted acyltransferase (DUF342 family)